MRELYLLKTEQVLKNSTPSSMRKHYKGKSRNKEGWVPVPESSVTVGTSFNLVVISLLCDRRKVARQVMPKAFHFCIQ